MNETVVTTDGADWNLTEELLHIAYYNNIVYYSLMVPVAICGNVFTLTAVAMVLKIKTSIPNLLIGVLACTDLFSLLTCHLITMASMVHGSYIGPAALCHFQSMMAYSYFKMGFLTKCCISLDRFIALAYPLRYRQLITVKKMIAVIVHNILFSFGTSAFTLVLDSEYIHQLTTWPMCVNNWRYYTDYKLAICVIEGAVFTLGVILFFVSNITVIRVVKKLNRKTKALFSIGKLSTEVPKLAATNNNATPNVANSINNAEQTNTFSNGKLGFPVEENSNVTLKKDENSNKGTSIGNGSSHKTSSAWSEVYKNENEAMKTEHKKHNRQKKEIQLAKLVTIIVTVFVILWLPYMTVIYWEHHNQSHIHPLLEDIVIKLVFANCCINPIIYGVFNANFRKAYVYYLRMLAFYFTCKMTKRPQGKRQAEYAVALDNELLKAGVKHRVYCPDG